MTVQLIQFRPSLKLLQIFFQNITLKGYLTQRWIAITVSILHKNFLAKCRHYKQPKNVKFLLWSIIETPQGRCITFQGRCKNAQGRCKTISGEVRCSPENQAMVWMESCSIFYTTSASFLHMPHVCIFSVVSYHLVLHKVTHIK